MFQKKHSTKQQNMDNAVFCINGMPIFVIKTTLHYTHYNDKEILDFWMMTTCLSASLFKWKQSFCINSQSTRRIFSLYSPQTCAYSKESRITETWNSVFKTKIPELASNISYGTQSQTTLRSCYVIIIIGCNSLSWLW